MDGTIFEKIIKREIPADIVYEDEVFIAFLDIKPVNPGHILLVPKKPYENIFDMPDTELSKAGPLLKKLARAVKNAMGADGINIGMNNGVAAGQVVFHAHFHIMPRFRGDGYELWHGGDDSTEEMKKIAEKIRENI